MLRKARPRSALPTRVARLTRRIHRAYRRRTTPELLETRYRKAPIHTLGLRIVP